MTAPASHPPASVVRFADVGQTFPARGFPSVTALEGLDFAIGRHEFVTVLGPSGCGKSTLLRQIAGLLAPASGQVEIYGRAISEPRDEIDMVLQKPTLLPWFSVVDNVTLPMRHKYGRARPDDTARAHDLLALMGLSEFAAGRPNALSGSMRQRVAIACALLLDPEILLMDEPFSALDALTRDEMSFALLRIWQEHPKTVVFITHPIPEAVLLADRIVVMSARPGRVREIIDVDLPRPRSIDSFSELRFSRLINHIRAQLFTRLPEGCNEHAGQRQADHPIARLQAALDALTPLLAFAGVLVAWELGVRAFAVPTFFAAAAQPDH